MFAELFVHLFFDVLCGPVFWLYITIIGPWNILYVLD